HSVGRARGQGGDARRRSDRPLQDPRDEERVHGGALAVDLGLRDRVVVVTGASGGIGRALADEFAAEGARLVLHGHSRIADLRRHVASRKWRKRAIVAGGDLAKARTADALLAKALAKWKRVDVCVANAGAYPVENL